jgi:hypothetical protein
VLSGGSPEGSKGEPEAAQAELGAQADLTTEQRKYTAAPESAQEPMKEYFSARARRGQGLGRGTIWQGQSGKGQSGKRAACATRSDACARGAGSVRNALCRPFGTPPPPGAGHRPADCPLLASARPLRRFGRGGHAGDGDWAVRPKPPRRQRAYVNLSPGLCRAKSRATANGPGGLVN